MTIKKFKWYDGDSTAEEHILLSGFGEAILKFQTESPDLGNHNQYVVAIVLFNSQITGDEYDISALSAQTGLQRSSLKITLKRMNKKKLIEYYTSRTDNRKKYIRGTKVLFNQYLNLLDTTKKGIKLINKKLY
ncbi:MAG: hypothetical protein COB29_13320 [Sulfitobacter sp.]|nr:MAG: hypothetical protein COB29_13320 [Sulfitobacter sp.]